MPDSPAGTSAEPVLPTPPPLARAAALGLVTRQHLRLVDARDSRMGELTGRFDLACAAWTGSRSALALFYTPPPDAASAAADLGERIGQAARWGAERMRQQQAQRCDILLVPLARVPTVERPAAPPGVGIGVVWADAATGEAEALLPPSGGLPGARELRSVARALREGAEAPTLAAVDLAERETVRGGYLQPARQAMVQRPVATIALIVSFALVWLIEEGIANGVGRAPGSNSLYGVLRGYLDTGGLFHSIGADEWWRYVSSAFVHSIGVPPWHLLMNCWAMYVVGRLIEQLYGRLVVVGVFLATAVAGNVVTVAAAGIGLPGTTGDTIGASGGIVGLMGLLAVMGTVQGKSVPAGLTRALRQSIAMNVVIIVLIGLTIPNVNNYAHVAGGVAGALIGLVIPPLHSVGGREQRPWEKIALAIVIAGCAIALGFAAVNLLQALTSPPPIPTFIGQ